jgi:DNA-binding NarL/FixJ family response regulator
MADRDAATRPAVLPRDAAADGRPKLGVLLAIVDFPLLVAGYRAVIDAAPDLRVVGVIDSRETTREQVTRSTADIVVTECLPYTSAGCASFQAIEEIRAARPAARILAIECRCGSEQFSLAIRAGAHGFLTREAAAGDVLTALRCISRGETYVSPSIVTRMVNTYVLRSTPEAPDDAFDTLSERAREVFRLAAVGHTNREIARTLHLSEQTIHNHRAKVMEKLGFHDRVELLRYALRRGLIQGTEL